MKLEALDSRFAFDPQLMDVATQLEAAGFSVRGLTHYHLVKGRAHNDDEAACKMW